MVRYFHGFESLLLTPNRSQTLTWAIIAQGCARRSKCTARIHAKMVVDRELLAAQYMPNVDVLRMATGLAGELHALSGETHPIRQDQQV